jgi:ABC-type proline/glycine betaine transport system ATPase subunit
MLLDEPTTGLDPRSKRDVQEFVEEVQRDHDATIFLTTHDMREAEALCDRIAIIGQGRLIAHDTTRNLIALMDDKALTIVLDRDLAALPPVEFLAHILELADIRSAGRGGFVDSTTHRILGAVNESDSVAHVLYRSAGSHVRYSDPYQVEVLAIVRRGDRWYVRGSHRGAGFTNLAFLITRLDEVQPEPPK